MSVATLPWAQRVAAVTPADRNRTVDGLRAYAMVGVVLGHWLVTGLAAGDDGGLRQHSPLASQPMLIPLSWVLQTLGVFFFVSGYAAAVGLSRPSRSATEWVRARMRRLMAPVAAFVMVWLLVRTLLSVAAVPASTRHVVGKLMLTPLWFVLVLVLLTVVTPAVRAAVHRIGPAVALAPLAAVAAVDLARAVWPAIPPWLTSLNGVTAWLVPYVLGVALAYGHLQRRGTGIALLLAGLTAGALLVLAAGYPASAVGVPGDGRSNLDPPSLLIVALSVAQVGLALAAWGPLTRLLGRPAWWAGVVVLNLSAMTVFLWHQSALLTVAGAGHAFLGDPVGLIGAPTDGAWITGRLRWLPAFAAVLALWCLLLRRRTPFLHRP